MIKREEIIAMQAIALCFKPFLKPEEACIYTNLGRTQLVITCLFSHAHLLFSSRICLSV